MYLLLNVNGIIDDIFGIIQLIGDLRTRYVYIYTHLIYIVSLFSADLIHGFLFFFTLSLSGNTRFIRTTHWSSTSPSKKMKIIKSHIGIISKTAFHLHDFVTEITMTALLICASLKTEIEKKNYQEEICLAVIIDWLRKGNISVDRRQASVRPFVVDLETVCQEIAPSTSIVKWNDTKFWT